MTLDDFLAEYRRRSVESIVALLRESAVVSLQDLRELLAEAPELRGVSLAEVFGGRPRGAPARPTSSSAAARVAAYLLDLARTGTAETGGVMVKVPNHAQIGERVAATRETVSLALAILGRRNLVTVYPRWILVRDQAGLAVVAGRPPLRSSCPT